MKWFRSNIKHGSRLALLALAIQFVLSFGHYHGLAAQAAPAIQSGIQSSLIQSSQIQLSPRPFEASRASALAATEMASQPGQRQKPGSDRDSDSDSCAICAVMAMANAVLFATPPLLVLPQAIELLYLTTDAEFIHLNSVRVAFQPRAPPIS
jgi:Protein of unknown function (DUF2946)